MNIILIVRTRSKEETLLCSSSPGGNDMCCLKEEDGQAVPDARDGGGGAYLPVDVQQVGETVVMVFHPIYLKMRGMEEVKASGGDISTFHLQHV
jgi:hypothetical protein